MSGYFFHLNMRCIEFKAKDVSCFTTGTSSALLLSWDQKMGPKNVKESHETSVHTNSIMCIMEPTLKRCDSPL